MTAPLPAKPLVVNLDEGYGGTEIESAVLAPFGAVVVERRRNWVNPWKQ